MRTVASTLLQAVVLLGLGVLVGLGANAVRGRDYISLTRNYTPTVPRPSAPATKASGPTERPEPYGLATLAEVVQIVADSSRVGLDVLLDARNERAFERGHLPGAILCDPYNLGRDFDFALSMALGAERVILYCHGGTCEDSYLLGQELVGHGVLPERLFVFKGGWEAWQAHLKTNEASPPEAPAPSATTPAPAPAAGGSPSPQAPPPEAPASAADDPNAPVFHEVSLADAIELFEDEKTTHGLYVFVDARADDPYEAGHIPGAIQCDFYRIDYYFPDVLTHATGAEKIIVYCGGADCEDSLYVCGELLEADIPRAHIVLFKGGWEEWNKANLPTATGRGR